jgi:predicted metal-dependent peptidase
MENNELVGQISDRKFDKLLVKFLLTEPFFSSIVRHMRKIRTKEIPTAGVAVVEDSISLYWNPDFIEKLTTKEFFGLLKHECYHLIFKHVTSRKQDPHQMWNIATDLAINSIIPANELPKGGIIPGQEMDIDPDFPDEKTLNSARKISIFIASLPARKSSEWYMEKLKQEPDMEQMLSDCFEDGSGGFDVHFDCDNLSASDRELIEGKLKQAISEAANRAQKNNGWGSVSADVRKQIMLTLDDAVNWKKALTYFCGTKQKANKSRTFRRINRKYPYIHPGTKVKHTSNLAIYIDQSGSVGDDGIAGFFGALNDLAKNVSFRVYHFDTTIDDKNSYSWRKGKKYKLPMRTLSGGTCFNSVEHHFRKRAADYDGYIIMTDGCAPKPKTCISKRCWVLLPGYKLNFTADRRDSVITMDLSKG